MGSRDHCTHTTLWHRKVNLDNSAWTCQPGLFNHLDRSAWTVHPGQASLTGQPPRSAWKSQPGQFSQDGRVRTGHQGQESLDDQPQQIRGDISAWTLGRLAWAGQPGQVGLDRSAWTAQQAELVSQDKSS